MQRDWILGLGAISTLTVLVGMDLMLALATERGRRASRAIIRRMRR